ncbi:acyl-CoA thioesterase [Chloroflexota bacterium]
MSRITINLQSEFIFSTNIPIRIGDINLAGHLSHVSFFSIMEEARWRFIRSLGYKESNILIMTDASIVYIRQGNYGQTLKTEIAISDLTIKSFDMVYRISDKDTGVEMARSKTGHLMYDYHNQEVTEIPLSLKEKLCAR